MRLFVSSLCTCKIHSLCSFRCVALRWYHLGVFLSNICVVNSVTDVFHIFIDRYFIQTYTIGLYNSSFISHMLLLLLEVNMVKFYGFFPHIPLPISVLKVLHCTSNISYKVLCNHAFPEVFTHP